MNNWTTAEGRLLGKFLIAHLEGAREEVRHEIAEENRRHPVAKDDADTFDTYTPQTLRERSVRRAVANITAELDL